MSELISLQDSLELSRKRVKDLHREYLNPGLAALLGMLEMDKNFVQAQGILVWDDEGNEYLDFTSGFGALSLGHNHPAILDAVERVKGSPVLIHAALPKLAAALAHNLAAVSPGRLKNCFFCNSGSEAVEAALKLARAATGRQRLVYCDGSLHGKTFGALSVSGSDYYVAPFGPMVPECQKIPYGDTVALEMVLRDERAACFIVEPILVEAGVVVPGEGYLQKVREICSRYGTLLIVDETQTGLGRCGSLFACEREEVVPDIICLPKGLGGGVLPLSGIITTPEIWQKAYGDMEKCLLPTSTFGGNTLAAAAGIETLQQILELDLPRQVQEKGNYLLQKLKVLANGSSLIKEVRGRGLAVGIELSPLTPALYEKLADERTGHLGEALLSTLVAEDLRNTHRIITTYTMNNPRVLRIQPPLTVSYEELDRFIEALDNTVNRKFGGMLAATAEPAVVSSVLIVAHDDAFPPWVFLQEGEPMGISVEFFRALAEQANLNIKFIGATWSSIFPLLTNKQIDLIINAGLPNPVFEEYPVIASEPYAHFEAHLFMKRDPSDPKVTLRLEDIRGKRVGVQRAGVVASLLKEKGAQVVEYDNDTLSFLDHFWNKTDMVAAEKMVGLSLNQTYFQGCFQIVSEPLNKMDVVCLAHKDNSRLIDMINAEIARLKASHVITQIYEKYQKYSGPRRLEPRSRQARIR